MISLEEAQARLLALAPQTHAAETVLPDALGQYLAADVSARRTQPAKALSAMDGYAVRHDSLPGPWHVIGESAAGGSFDSPVADDEAVRIFTGAPLPADTDTIIIQEDISRDGEKISVAESFTAKLAQHVRAAGSDFAKGDIVANKDDCVTPALIGLTALADIRTLPVRRKPRIALVSTGDELVDPGQPVGENQIPASNSVMMQAQLAALPCTVTDNLLLRDDMQVITDALAALDVDIIVTIGGASVGDHDLVKPALKAIGAELDFYRVAMRPGKPVIAGKLKDAVVVGLPGNPASAFVSAFLFLMPLIRHMAGSPAPLPVPFQAKLDAPLPANGPRTAFLRGIAQGGKVTPLASRDSAMLTSLSRANVLLRRAGNAKEAATGDLVDCYRL